MCELLEGLFDVERNQTTLRGSPGKSHKQERERVQGLLRCTCHFLSVLAKQLGKLFLLKGLAK